MAKLQQPSRQKCPDPFNESWCCIVSVTLAGTRVSLASLRGLPSDKIVRGLFKPKQQAVAFISDPNCFPHLLQLHNDLLGTDNIGGTPGLLSDIPGAPSE